MAAKLGIDWGSVSLGSKSDPELAAELGVERTTVRDARVRRGIPAYRPPGWNAPVDALEVNETGYCECGNPMEIGPECCAVCEILDCQHLSRSAAILWSELRILGSATYDALEEATGSSRTTLERYTKELVAAGRVRKVIVEDDGEAGDRVLYVPIG